MNCTPGVMQVRAGLWTVLATVSLLGNLASATDANVNWSDVHQHISGFGACSDWNGAISDAQADIFFPPRLESGCPFCA